MSGEHYVNNKELYGAMCEYIGKVKQAVKDEQPRPQVPNYIASCILKIATRLASKHNYFGNKHYHDEMIMDGVENCLRYIHNFDPEKSNNPFAYFTQTIGNAFSRRIEMEKKEDYIKHKFTRHSAVLNGFEEPAGDEEGTTQFMENDSVSEFIESFEAHMEKKKAKRKQIKAAATASIIEQHATGEE
jgi:hypothetical protein